MLRGRAFALSSALVLVVGVVVVSAGSSGAGVTACSLLPIGVVNATPSPLLIQNAGACNVTHAEADGVNTNPAPLVVRAEDFNGGASQGEALWHFGAARKIVTSAATAFGSAVITSAGGHFSAVDINHGVSGFGIPVCAFIKTVTGNVATLNVPTSSVQMNAGLLVENSDGRCFTGTVSAGSTTVTSASANFRAAGDIGRDIVGGGLPHGTFITAVQSVTSVTVSAAAPASAAGVSLSILPLAPIGAGNSLTSTTRQIDDAVITGVSGATNILCSQHARFVPTDVNLPVLTPFGANLGGGPIWITQVAAGLGVAPCAANQYQAVLNTNVTGALPTTVVIGQPNATAPSPFGAESVGGGGITMDAPAAWGGVCNGVPVFNWGNAVWNNPGSFAPAPTFGTALDLKTNNPTRLPAIAQLMFTFMNGKTIAGYVEPVPAAVPGELAPTHYDVVFPKWPLACVGGANDEQIWFNFAPTTGSQVPFTVPPHIGTPGTDFVRAWNYRRNTALTNTTGKFHFGTYANVTIFAVT